MTSFQGLISRNSTNEWLSPPAENEQSSRRYSNDLYDLGVDAHCGKVRCIVSSQREPTKPPLYSRTFFNTSYLPKDSGAIKRRRSTVGSNSSKRGSVGSSLGVSSRKRKSSASSQQRNDTHSSTLPDLINKIQQKGKKIFHSLSDTKGYFDARSRVNSPKESPEGNSNLKSTNSKTDTSGTWLSVRKVNNDTCSEDNRPHLCEDELESIGRGSTPASVK